MTLFRANFDYESELFWGKKEDWAAKMLEYLFFFCASQRHTLYTKKKYSKDYLEFVKKIMGYSPKTSSMGEPENWWGKIEKVELEKKLNSKVTSFEIANKLGINNSKSRLILKLKELEDFLMEEKDIFLRHPYERAGRVSFRINGQDDFNKNINKFKKILLNQPLIADRFFACKKWDLGTCLIQEGGGFEISYQIKNLNDNQGVFRGAVLLEENIESEELLKIGEAYYELGARNFLQVDSFAHSAGINWLCEVNYRKTMGFIVHRLNRLIEMGQSLALIMTPKVWLKEFVTHNQLIETANSLENIIPLSPIESPIYCWMISGENRNALLSKTKGLWELVALKPNEFPEVFNKITSEKFSPEIDTLI